MDGASFLASAADSVILGSRQDSASTSIRTRVKGGKPLTLTSGLYTHAHIHMPPQTDMKKCIPIHLDYTHVHTHTQEKVEDKGTSSNTNQKKKKKNSPQLNTSW